MAQVGKESIGQCRRCRRHEFDSFVGNIPWRREWQPTTVFLPGKIPWAEEPGGLQSLGCKELDTTEHLSAAEIEKPGEDMKKIRMFVTERALCAENRGKRRIRGKRRVWDNFWDYEIQNVYVEGMCTLQLLIDEEERKSLA